MLTKKIISYILITLIMIFTIVALLGIWNIVDLEDIMGKVFKSLFIVFCSSAIILFIFSMINKNEKNQN
jgi:hypothetical protein